MLFGSFEDGNDGEYSDVGFGEISEILADGTYICLEQAHLTDSITPEELDSLYSRLNVISSKPSSLFKFHVYLR